MESSNKVSKISRKRPLKSEWSVVNKSHSGKPNHRKHLKEQEQFKDAV